MWQRLAPLRTSLDNRLSVQDGKLTHLQNHLKPALKANAQPIGPESTDSSLSLNEWDGCAVIEVHSLEGFAAAFKDPYYLNVIAPDEDKFVNKKLGVLRARGEVKQII